MKILCKHKALIENFFLYLKAAPHSPRRQKLNLRMKSLSLDSPESTELHGRGRRYPPSASVYQHGGSGGHLEHSTPPSNNSKNNSRNNSRLHCKFLKVKTLNDFVLIAFFSTQHLQAQEISGNCFMPRAV